MTHAGVLSGIASLSGANASPVARLARGSDGNFYGCGNGAVFKVTPSGTQTTLFTFSGTTGSSPTARMMQWADGKFYGTTEYGGTNGQGVVFRMTPSGGLSGLFSFNNGNGANPDAEIIQGADGNLYGTTSVGGSAGGGNIYVVSRLAPVLLSIGQPANNAIFAWTAVIGQTYQIQYNTNLTLSAWNNLGDPVIATNVIMTATDTAGLNPQCLYRVILQ
jgi:uncharacterized repeat protein (TIGR03803 family)